jgi:hypothetical protein
MKDSRKCLEEQGMGKGDVGQLDDAVCAYKIIFPKFPISLPILFVHCIGMERSKRI